MKSYMFAVITAVLASGIIFHGCARAKVTDKEFAEYSEKDIKSLSVSRQAMSDVIRYMKECPEIFDSQKTKDRMSLNREQRLSAWHTYQAFLDHVLTMDALGMTYSQLYKRSDGNRKKKAFRISYAAFLAQYRYAMDFITIIEKNPDFHIILNEPVPELGLPENTYSRLKYRFLNVIRGGEFATLNIVYRFYRKDPDLAITKGMEEDISVIWSAGRGRGPIQTAQNGIKILQDSAFTAWFPVQKGVSNLMSKIRVRRKDVYLISQGQIKEMISELEPGDIMLQRREWCLTNIGLPGFWTHAAMYIGTPDERIEFFDDPDAKKWVKSQGKKYIHIEDLLSGTYPKRYKKSLEIQNDTRVFRVIEAKGEGVIFTTLEDSAYADSLVVLRPKVPKKTKARAIFRAFNFQGRPYDFNFDFLTDAAVVCSELVYKAYLHSDNSEGLNLPLSDVLGRKVISPNNIARLFDDEYNTEPQLDFVLFLDGNEKTDKASRVGVEAFRESWERPKWHIIIKNSDDKIVSVEDAKTTSDQN